MASLVVGVAPARFEFAGTPAECLELWRGVGSPGAEPLPPEVVIHEHATTRDWEDLADRSTIPERRSVVVK